MAGARWTHRWCSGAQGPRPAPAVLVPLHPGAVEFYRDHG